MTGWGLTGMLVVLYLLNASDKAVFGLIAQPLREDLDLSASQIGFTGSLFFLAFTVGGFLAGPINIRSAARVNRPSSRSTWRVTSAVDRCTRR
ncbi:hypothetical protein NN3_20960 [Nocardia neocaledoniensis NBRC 108232]|uniref:MFS transporter n=1 Tax=Nocardia neocaledoniensis TaxID=236511 RepID=A0A317N3V6_9NOCA|nr:hypothetical protein DFR69_115183 [Nocardia neocaledoniensis]GEM31089.1 hypothetical protein NN3_20960 [Nocardia neocaledoniensis NBRC 108232]